MNGRPVLREQPEHCPGAYVMHFYCKYRNQDHPHQRDLGDSLYMEECEDVHTRTAAIRQMREAGWLYHSDGTATCPRCRNALSTPQATDSGVDLDPPMKRI